MCVAVTRLTSEEQLAWAALDQEKKEGPLMMAIAKVPHFHLHSHAKTGMRPKLCYVLYGVGDEPSVACQAVAAPG